MFRPVLLALSLLLPVLLPPVVALAEPPRATPEARAQASDWFIGHWAHQSHLDAPDFGPGLLRADMVVRADRTLELTGSFTQDGATIPATSLRMTATWWMEDADPLGLRVRLENDIYIEDGAPPQSGGLETNVMNLEIRPDGTLVDFDDGITWTRRGP